MIYWKVFRIEFEYPKFSTFDCIQAEQSLQILSRHPLMGTWT